MTASLARSAFFMVVFLTFFPPECPKRSSLQISGNVIYQNRIVVEPGENVTFNFTTQHGNPILATQFGLKGKGENILRKFIIVNKIHGIQCGKDFNTSEGWRYRTRVFFVGNITVGHAWFMITNVEENDTNTYQVDIRKITDKKYKMYTVELLVRRKNEASPTTPSKQPSPPAPEPPSSTKTPASEIAIGIASVVAVVLAIPCLIYLVKKCKPRWRKAVPKINPVEQE